MKKPHAIVKPLTHAILIAISCAASGVLADTDKKTEVPRIDTVVRIDPVLERMAAEQASLPVIIIFGDQPQRAIARKLNAEYERDIDNLAARVRSIYDRYLTKESLASKDKEVEHSKLLAQYITDADKKEIRALNEQRESLMRKLRQEIARESELAVARVQESQLDAITRLGAKVQEKLVTTNAISAIIPAASLKELGALQGVAEVIYNTPGKPELDNQATSLGADNWWATGFDGGIWDVGVIDDGVLETHTGLNTHTFYENFAGNGNHGTGVACMYAGTDATRRGLAFGLDSILVENAGDEATTMAGADWMLRSAGDDPEVINYSWGNGDATGSDWHPLSRFVDGVVFDYATNWAKSAGNQGFGTNTMTVPATNYNGLTVANMADNNTVSRADDVITASSSRGPTVDNRKKPDLSAPGNQTRTCNASGGYSDLGGTSSAAPKVGAATLLLTDAGNWDPRSIKAVLINTADSWEDNDTQSTADDGAKTGKEWNKTYGWGYMDLAHAHFHRNDFFASSVKPKGQTGSFKLYKGTMYKGDKATLVWERDVDYNNAATPTSFRALSDLDLKLYAEPSNSQLDSDTSVRDNVHQVAATATQSAVVKVYAYSSSFDGASSEPFSLATEENFVAASGPVFSNSITAPASVLLGTSFTYSVAVKNTGDLDAHNVNVKINLPAGFSLVSGALTQSAGTLADGATKTLNWTVKAPSYAVSSASISVTNTSSSYGETFTGSGAKAISVKQWVLTLP
ncbi:S8 family serine peptidase [Cellvibrio fontiphilus]|uniref:S8 family serine peptidase n=1 Tax=Cellvibrio fontiphilus TaxID=1815559 RepID=A0ABV7FII0_9GAMM